MTLKPINELKWSTESAKQFKRTYLAADIDGQVNDTQLYFRNGITRVSLFSFVVLKQRCWDINIHICIRLINYCKHFTKLQIIKMLQTTDVSVRINLELYCNQIKTMKIELITSELIQMMKEVRKGYILASNVIICSEATFREDYRVGHVKIRYIKP